MRLHWRRSSKSLACVAQHGLHTIRTACKTAEQHLPVSCRLAGSDCATGRTPQVDTKFVIEAANGPTTPEGDKVLRDRGIVVLPDIYTNAGAAQPPSPTLPPLPP